MSSATAALSPDLHGQAIDIETIHGHKIHGLVFCVDHTLGCVVVQHECSETAASRKAKTRRVAGQAEKHYDFHILKIRDIKALTVLPAVPADLAGVTLVPVQAVSAEAALAREQAAVQRELERLARINTNVSPAVQQLFDGLAKTMQTRWDGDTIIVMNDEIAIAPPYGEADVRLRSHVVVDKPAEILLQRIKTIVKNARCR
ncbi:hypothetical protein CXG81DRAFT_16660 [Caulochytrium protostelioides]|uniref:AD domain-containing protein n=1 Tax=Caulochytrium protostelioides TaxID=1555241 RepID=A0A4P9XE65_9FUNG|nr:hypothetical protein CXG81DRAFT_16660 [Caulochytrium protostelioides]|eukprot:RKP03825.1 hypothetical protein CXG81DRAFT_16660 [Caulochytrium protostelioides]